MADAKPTMLAADEPEVASALLLFSYPLHPPGKPDRLRIEHFPRLRVRAVFVHGASRPVRLDPGAALGGFADPGPTEIIPIAGAGHDLKRGRFDLGPVVAALLAQPAFEDWASGLPSPLGLGRRSRGFRPGFTAFRGNRHRRLSLGLGLRTPPARYRQQQRRLPPVGSRPRPFGR